MSGLVLLRVAPLLAATSSVTFTWCEDFFIRPLITNDTELRSHANRILPRHGRWLWSGLAIVFTTYPLSIATAAANLAHKNGSVDIHGVELRQRIAGGFYLAGLIFSVLHFPWGHRAMHLLRTIRQDTNVEGDKAKDNTAIMATWLKLNALRGLSAEIPSWICYFVAFMVAMS